MKFNITLAASLLLATTSTFASIGKVSHKVFDTFDANPVVFYTTSGTTSPELPPVYLDVVFFDVTADVLQSIEDQGIVVHSVSGKFKRAGLEVTTRQQVAFLSGLSQVQHIYTAPARVNNAGSVYGTARDAMFIAPYDPSTPWTGKGVSIGIISDSFARAGARADDILFGGNPFFYYPSTGYITETKPQRSGDLPSSVYAAFDASYGRPVIDEGAAMAELVYDIAPEADLSFHSAGLFPSDFAEAIDHLCLPEGDLVDIPYWPKRRPTDPDEYSHGTDPNSPATGVGADIVVDDIGFISSSVYYDDVIAMAANDCFNRGKIYFTAAGNQADRAIRQVYNHADLDKDFTNPLNDRVLTHGHDWSADASSVDSAYNITMAANQEVVVALHWNQPALSVQENKTNFPGVDLDLVIIHDQSNTVIDRGYSVNNQSLAEHSADPWEYVSIKNFYGDGASFSVYVYHSNGSTTSIPQNSEVPIEFRLGFYLTDKGQIDDDSFPVWEYPFNTSPMSGQVIADGAISVGAVPYWESPAFNSEGGPTSEIDPEPFTSVGGVITKQFNSAGEYEPMTVLKPDFSAVDAVNTTFFGQQINDGDSFPNFFGTSAAAPNAAAMAALYMEASEFTYTNEQLRSALYCSSWDVKGKGAAPGFDSLSGRGLLVYDLPEIKLNSPETATPGQLITLTAEITSFRAIDSAIWSIEGGLNQKVGLDNSIQFTAPDTGQIVVKLRATDSCGIKNVNTKTIRVQSDLTPPVVSIDVDFVDGLEPRTIEVSADDVESDISDISWEVTQGVATINPVSEDPKRAVFTPSAPGLYQVKVTATNGAGLKTVKTTRFSVVDYLVPTIKVAETTLNQVVGQNPKSILVDGYHMLGGNPREITLLVEQKSGSQASIVEVASVHENGKRYEIKVPTVQPGEYKFFVTATVVSTGMVSTEEFTARVTASTQPTSPEQQPSSPDNGSGSGGGAIHFWFLATLLLTSMCNRVLFNAGEA